MTRPLWVCLLAVAVVPLGAEPLGTEPPTLAPGSVLAVSGSLDEHVLAEFSTDGELLGQIEVADPAEALGTPSGLTTLDGQLWISGHSSVHPIDPATGEVGTGFTATDGPTITALCSDGETLLVGEFTANAFRRFDTDGNLLGTIELDSDQLFLVGADCDDEFLYVGSHATGHIHIFDMAGMPVDVIETNQSANLSAVSLGGNGDTIWAANGLGINEIQEFDLDGNLLRSFDGQFQLLMGLFVLRDGLFGDGFESGDTSSWSVTAP